MSENRSGARRPLFRIGAAALLSLGSPVLGESPSARGATLEQRIKHLEDRADIDQLISRLSEILDARDIAALPEVATPEFAVVMAPGLRKMKTMWLTAQHIMTERWIDIDGDRATVKANLIGTNIGKQLPGRSADNFSSDGRDHYEVRGRYVYHLVRTPRGWRIANTNLTYLWTYGAPPAGN